MRPLFAPIVTTIVLLLSARPVAAQEINWRHDFNAARREAQESGKPLFLDVGTQACHWCQQLDVRTFRVPAVVRQINENFIPVRIDANRDPVTAGKLGIHSYPTLVMLDASGRMINRKEGFCEAGPMTHFLDQGRQVASRPSQPQFRGQAREDRIPARALAIEEPARPALPPQPLMADEKPRSRQEGNMFPPVALTQPQQIAINEQPRPQPLTIQLPSPEELGIVAEKPTPVQKNRPIDWAALHTRLNSLGSSSFIVQRPTAQLVRIISLFPIADNRVHRVEASATTEAEAVRLFLEQVDEWAAHP
jgi:thioredoxin-related protein